MTQSTEKTAEKTVAIIGTGLIGASIGLALRGLALGATESSPYRVLGWDLAAENAVKAAELGAIDVAVADNDFNPAFAAADIIIVATPPSAIVANIVKAAKVAKDDALITDTGSVKQAILKSLGRLPPKVHFIGSHPIAGTEHSGPAAAEHGLFDGRWCVVTPTAAAAKTKLGELKSLWRDVGMRVLEMSAAHHDKTLSLTSHLPHLVAYALTNQVLQEENLEEKDHLGEIARLSAGGLRDFTRIAASDAVMWRDIFVANAAEIEESLKGFEANIGGLRRLIAKGDTEAIEKYLRATKRVRMKIVAERQH